MKTQVAGYYKYTELFFPVPVGTLSLCCVRLFATPGTVARRAPRSSKNIGVGCHSLLQGIFLNQGWNPRLLRLLHWQADSLSLSHLGCPEYTDETTFFYFQIDASLSCFGK